MGFCREPFEIKKLCRTIQRQQKNITGYFGGYISKAQPIGVYELKKSIATLPYLKKKLLERQSKPSHQLAHTVNKMFTTLESKGIVRTTPQEFQLSADYDEKDIFAAMALVELRRNRYVHIVVHAKD